MSLRTKAVSSIIWTAIQQMSSQGITFIVSIILARILLPEEFGLIALLGVFIAIGNTLIDSGLNQSLIRTNNVTIADYSVVFFFNLIISVCIYFLMYVSAEYIALFYEQPLLSELIKIYSLVFIINSFAIIQNTKLVKDLNFKKQALIAIPSLLIASIVGITMAYNGYGVWSLVWSALVKAIVYSGQLWIFQPWKPTLNISWHNIKPHLNFGYKLTISNLIDALFRDAYTIIIGKFFDPTQVGFYNRADSMKQLPVNNFGAILNKVTYPLFSKIQNDDEQLKRVYKKIMQMSVFLIAPTLLFMVALAEPLFRFLLTEKWLPAVPYFQILCFSGILYPIHSYNLNILTVKGRSDLFLKIEIIKKVIFATVILVSINWGIYGLLYGKIFMSIIGLFINSHYSGKFINYKIWEQLRDISPALLIALISSFFIFMLDKYEFENKLTDIYRLIIGVGLGLSIYGFLVFVFRLDSFTELKKILGQKKS